MIIVVDKISSGLGIAAQARSNLTNDVRVVSAFDFCGPDKLVLHLLSSQDSVVIFAWRGALSEMMRVASEVHLASLKSEKIIGVSVADHASVSRSDMPYFEIWMDIVDFICVTNSTLLEIYKKINNRSLPIFLLRDLPNLNLLESVEKLDFYRRPIDVIWVGNSKWGARQGYRDHKGLNEFFKPAVKLLLQLDKNLVIEVIDSAVKPVNHQDVLRMLSRSKVLVQTSKHEGTGLPVLEALILGCRVVSTPVGIVNELSGSSGLIVSNFSPSSIAEDVIKSLNGPAYAFDIDSYINETPDFQKVGKSHAVVPVAKISRTLTSLLLLKSKWLFRCFKNKLIRTH